MKFIFSQNLSHSYNTELASAETKIPHGSRHESVASSYSTEISHGRERYVVAAPLYARRDGLFTIRKSLDLSKSLIQKGKKNWDINVICNCNCKINKYMYTYMNTVVYKVVSEKRVIPII